MQGITQKPYPAFHPSSSALHLSPSSSAAMTMGHRRRQRLSKPRPFLGFSSFARSILFSHSAPTPSTSAKFEEDANAPPKSIKRVESEEDEDDEEEIDMVQADFGFFDPKPSDFSGVKLLLQNFLDNKLWDLSGFVDLILEQMTVGTVVKLDDPGEGDHGSADNDDAGTFAVISALNLRRYEDHKCIKELKEFLLQACVDEISNKKLKSLLEQQARDVGLLVSQRFVNCPYQLVPPLYAALFDEISWATEDEPTEEHRDSFRFKYYVLITKIFQSKSTQHKRKLNNDSVDPIIYVKPEDEIFHELSLLSFTFDLHAQRLASEELKNYREKGLVMVIKADEIPKFQEKLKSLLAES